MTRKLVDAAVQCGLATATSDGAQILWAWSDKIWRDFDMQNNAEQFARN